MATKWICHVCLSFCCFSDGHQMDLSCLSVCFRCFSDGHPMDLLCFSSFCNGFVWPPHGFATRSFVCRCLSNGLFTGNLPPCKGICRAMEKVLVGNRNHHSIATLNHEYGSCIPACTRCGAWMESKLRDLLEPCPVACLGASRASLKQAARDALGRVSRGQHPRPAKGPGRVLGLALLVPKVGPARVDDDD